MYEISLHSFLAIAIYFPLLDLFILNIIHILCKIFPFILQFDIIRWQLLIPSTGHSVVHSVMHILSCVHLVVQDARHIVLYLGVANQLELLVKQQHKKKVAQNSAKMCVPTFAWPHNDSKSENTLAQKKKKKEKPLYINGGPNVCAKSPNSWLAAIVRHCIKSFEAA